MDYLKLKRLIKEGVKAQLLYESKRQKLFEDKKVPELEDTEEYKKAKSDNDNKSIDDYMQATAAAEDKRKAEKYETEIGDPDIVGHNEHGDYMARRFDQIKDVTIAAFIQAFNELFTQHTNRNNKLLLSIVQKELLQIKKVAQEINTYAPGHMWGTFCTYLVKIKSTVDDQFKNAENIDDDEKSINYDDCRSIFLDIIVSNLEKLSGYLLKIKNKMKGEEAVNREKCITEMSTAIIAMVERVFKYRTKNKMIRAIYEYSDIDYKYSDKYNPKSNLDRDGTYELNTDKIYF